MSLLAREDHAGTMPLAYKTQPIQINTPADVELGILEQIAPRDKHIARVTLAVGGLVFGPPLVTSVFANMEDMEFLV